jgi:hypothetical protein
MAYIRTHETQQRRKGKAVKRYEVIWREPATDPSTGLPTGRMRARQESYATSEAAQARRDALNAARHTTGTTALGDQRKAGAIPLANYAQGWLAVQNTKVATGAMKPATYEHYANILAHDVLPRFGAKAVAEFFKVDESSGC